MRVAQGVRLDAAGPELVCRWCDEWWPLTREYWCVNRDGRVRTDRCRECERERARLYQRLRLLDPEYRHENADKARKYRLYVRKTAPDLLAAHGREVANRNRLRTAAWKAKAA